MISISRRRFLALAGGLLTTGCTVPRGEGEAWESHFTLDPTTTTPPSGSSLQSTGSPATTAPVDVTTVSVPVEMMADDHVLVLIELEGGNDAVNTVPPLTGAYRDLRPTIAIPEDQLVDAALLPGHAFHPALSPLAPMLDDGRLSVIAGIGFPDPDRSHFVSTDRWMRADRMDETMGWLGRWLDTLPDDLPALGATALGGGGKMLLGGQRRGTVIDEASAFAFPIGLGNGAIRTLTEPIARDPLHAAAQRAFLDSIGAVGEFDAIADAVREQLPTADAGALSTTGGAFSTGLAVAAQLVVGDVGTRVVTVSGGGFDTHGDQLRIHTDLLADLSAGLAAFWKTIDDAGLGDRVLVATHSEFGRRVRENASGGCDHGAAGVSFLMGNAVAAGLHGSIDTGNLLDGDLRAQIDPRTLFTACLDWLGGDVEQVLGHRYDEVALLA